MTSLHVYPVKSCAGHEVQQATLGDRGFEMDRLWLVVDGRGRFMTQRKCPKMAQISPSLPKSHDEVWYVAGAMVWKGRDIIVVALNRTAEQVGDVYRERRPSQRPVV